MHRKGRLLLVLVLPDGSKSLIPAEWTNLASTAQPLSTVATTLGSSEDLLHARAVIDALLSRLAPATREDGNSPATKESTLARKNRNLFDFLLDESDAWETLPEEHQAVALQILARLIAQAARPNQEREKNHE